MPYLRPELVLDRFSTFARDDVRPAIVGDGDEFLEAQVGSMSSTLSFLSKELDGMGDAVETQHESLVDALDDAEQVLADVDADGDTDQVRSTIAETKGRLSETVASDPYAHERAILEGSSAVLEAVDDHLDETTARAVRTPLYRFLRTRVESQLELLGRGSR